MDWGEYLTRGAYATHNTGHSAQTVYHMCIQSQFDAMTQNKANGEISLYYPPTYEKDGNMIHATAVPSMLLEVANHFYKESSTADEWICLAIDPKLLGVPLIYEGMAPVGEKPPPPAEVQAEIAKEVPTLLFPHIYGGISRFSVTSTYKIIRNQETGEFLAIENLVPSK